MCWPQSSFGFLCKMLWKNLNKRCGQPNTSYWNFNLLVQVSPSSMIEGWSSTQELSKYMEEYLDLWKINHTTGGYFLLLVFCPPSSMKWLSNKAFFHLGFSEPSYFFAMCSYNMESRNVYHISDIRLETSHIFMYNIPCTFISDIYFNSSNSSIPTLIHWGINEYQKDFLHRQ